MVIAVFGASGKVGRLVVAEALARGYSVRALVHQYNNLPASSHVTVIRGDIRHTAAVADTLHGCTAVASTLGSWGTPTKDVVTQGMRRIIPLMERQGIERIVTLTGTDALDSTDQLTLSRRLSHLFAKLVARKILADGEEHIRLLRKSSLDWTTLRAPAMTNSPRIFYKLSMQPLRPWDTIPRKAIAKAIVDQLDGPSYSRCAPFVHPY
jgi:putative NADH-flavin reductase